MIFYGFSCFCATNAVLRKINNLYLKGKGLDGTLPQQFILVKPNYNI